MTPKNVVGGVDKKIISQLDDMVLTPHGNVRKLGFGKTAAYSAVAAGTAYAAARTMGYGKEESTQIAGAVSAIPVTMNPQGVMVALKGIKSVIDKKGTSYVFKKLVEKGGKGLLFRSGAKLILGTSTGVGALLAGASLAYDIYTIYDLLKDEIE